MTPDQWHGLVDVLLQDIELTRADVDAAYAEGYAHGHADGFEAGYAASEQYWAEHWSMIARNIRANAGRPTYSARRKAELEAAKPREGDFMGQLSRDEYMNQFNRSGERAA